MRLYEEKKKNRAINPWTKPKRTVMTIVKSFLKPKQPYKCITNVGSAYLVPPNLSNESSDPPKKKYPKNLIGNLVTHRRGPKLLDHQEQHHDSTKLSRTSINNEEDEESLPRGKEVQDYQLTSKLLSGRSSYSSLAPFSSTQPAAGGDRRRSAESATKKPPTEVIGG